MSVPDATALAASFHLSTRCETDDQRRARILSHYGPEVRRSMTSQPARKFVQGELLPLGEDAGGGGSLPAPGGRWGDTGTISVQAGGALAGAGVAVGALVEYVNRLDVFGLIDSVSRALGGA